MATDSTQTYVTDRKRATGLGSGRAGTQHHWQMMVSSMLLGIVIPAFLITFALGLGGTYDDAVAFYGKPIPAIILALSWVVIVRHMMNEALEAIEDYVHGVAGKLTQVATTAFSYTLMAVGVFAVARMAI